MGGATDRRGTPARRVEEAEACSDMEGGGSWYGIFQSLQSSSRSPSWFRQVQVGGPATPVYQSQSSEGSLKEKRGRYHRAERPPCRPEELWEAKAAGAVRTRIKMERARMRAAQTPPPPSPPMDPPPWLEADEKAEKKERRSAEVSGGRRGGTYLSSAFSVKPAAASAARYCSSTPRTLFTNPLESGKSGKPMSG